MSGEHRDVDQRALDALRGIRVLPRPSEAARTRTRSAFVGEPARPRTPRPRRSWSPAWAAAAVVAALAVGWFGSLPREPWTVRAVSGSSTVALDGVERSLRPGRSVGAGRFEIGDSTEVELAYGDLLLRLRPGTVADLPAPPGRWFSRTRTLELSAGEAYGSSGAHEVGFDLRLRTPEAQARMTGTTFAVLRSEGTTCFCLYRGGLEVTPRGAAPFVLPVQRRVFVHSDGRAPTIEELEFGEAMKLRMVDDAAHER